MSVLIKDIMRVAKVSEVEAEKIEEALFDYFVVDYSESTQREIDATIREAVRFMNMKCNHPTGTQHTWECVA
jgi:hypothetical protein